LKKKTSSAEASAARWKKLISHLAGADLVDQRVDVELHLLAVVVDVLEQRVELR
jgi:hypothetical protein